jgi:hypothetical protein
MRCKICEKLNTDGRGEEFGEGTVIRPGIYLATDSPWGIIEFGDKKNGR